MPRVKDLTGELGRLRGRNRVAEPSPVPLPAAGLERPMALNASGIFVWSLVGSFLLLQGLFLGWLVVS